MDASLKLLHECIIMDACCVINLYASGQIRAILSAIPKSVAVTAYVRKREARHIYSGPLGKKDISSPKEKIDLQPLIDDQVIVIVAPNSDDERDDAVDFGRFIHTGEAYTGAIAKSRNWAIASDDSEAIAFFSKNLKHNQVISTLALIKHWEDTTQPPAIMMHQVLKDIQIKASYTPRPSHPFHAWWLSRIIIPIKTTGTASPSS